LHFNNRRPNSRFRPEGNPAVIRGVIKTGARFKIKTHPRIACNRPAIHPGRVITRQPGSAHYKVPSRRWEKHVRTIAIVKPIAVPAHLDDHLVVIVLHVVDKFRGGRRNGCTRRYSWREKHRVRRRRCIGRGRSESISVRRRIRRNGGSTGRRRRIGGCEGESNRNRIGAGGGIRTGWGGRRCKRWGAPIDVRIAKDDRHDHRSARRESPELDIGIARVGTRIIAVENDERLQVKGRSSPGRQAVKGVVAGDVILRRNPAGIA
jgi:hypothetical protein